MDKSNKLFQDGLNRVLKTYGKLSPVHPSSYMLYNEKAVKDYCLDVCHANMVYQDAGTWDHLITAVPSPIPEALPYIQMLIDGPYRGFSHLISIHTDKASGLPYIECSNLDQWPANVLFNFCIATRTPTEWPAVFEQWQDLVKKGYDRTLAFLIASSNNGEVFIGDTRTWIYTNHMWVDAASDWNLTLKGTPTNLSGPYRDKPSRSIPTNRIWGRSDDYLKLIHMSDKDIADYFKMPPVVLEPPAPRRRKAGKQMVFDLEGWPPPIGANPAAAPQWQWAQNIEIGPAPEIAPVQAFQGIMDAPAPAPDPEPQPFVEVDDWDFPDDFDPDEEDDDDF